MSFDLDFHELGFFTGISSPSALVPSQYTHALDGHPYLIDRSADGYGLNRFRHATIPTLRQSTQTNGPLGEQSINPAGLWRSSVETWHKGAGQTAFDLADSDPARFHTSKGVDPWTRWQASLLPATATVSASVNANLALAATSSRLFYLDDTAVKYTDDLVTVNTMSGAHAWTSITSDGYYVYACDGSDLYRWIRTDTAVGSAFNTTDMDLVRWVRGKARLMASDGNLVFNVTSASTPANIAPNTISTDFVWVDFCDGPNGVYGAGYQGDKSMIFRWGIMTDGSGLDVAIPALDDGLPDGEIIRCMASYLGFVLIGTDQGVRFALPNSGTGNLTVGALVDLGVSVRCFEGQGSSVWYGWSNYDGGSTGLGRLSLTTFTDPNLFVPAYASDLMATAQGIVSSVVTFNDRRVFSVQGAGIFREDTDLVAEGTITSGWRSFGIPDNKVAIRYLLRHEPLDGSISVGIAVDGETSFAGIGTSNIAGSTAVDLPANEITAERFDVQLTLDRSALSSTAGPTITRDTLSMNPTADTSFYIYVPILLFEEEKTLSGSTQRRNVAAELEHLFSLRHTRQIVVYQEGSVSYSVSVEDLLWLPDKPTQDGKAYQGACITTLKVV